MFESVTWQTVVAPNQSGAILCAPETEIPPRNFGGNHPRDLHGKHGKVNNAPVLEIQPEASFFYRFIRVGFRHSSGFLPCGE